jgi:AcrR family transcriptional regulator
VATSQAAGRARRSRRPSAEVHDLLLDSARQLFAANGYAGTTTKDIASRAGVSERLLFTHFGSKDELFQVAVEGPFLEVVADYMSSWEVEAPGMTSEHRIHRFVSGLFDLARENRAILRSALARRTESGDDAEERLIGDLARALQGLEGTAVATQEPYGFEGIDPPVTVAAAGAMIFGMALLDDLLFPQGTRRPSRERLTTEMTQMLLHGSAHRSED